MRRARGLLIVLAALAAGPAAAGDLPARLRAAETALATATGAEERLVALGALAGAHEAALVELRARLRELHAGREALEARLAPADGARLIAVAALERAVRAPRPAWLVHPGGALAAARGTMLLGAIAGGHTEAVAGLRADLAALDALARAQREALALAADALAGLERTRREAALASPPGTPAVLPSDAALAAAAEDVATLVAVLETAAMAPDSATAQAEAFAARRGQLPLPALAEGDAVAEEARLVLAAPAYAGVRSPALATVRHVGPLGPRGHVVVLEPAPRLLLVLQGLGEVTVSAGAIVPEGAPLGTLGGPAPSSEDLLIDASTTGGTLPRVRLYIEVWNDGRPEHAAAWFRSGPG